MFANLILMAAALLIFAGCQSKSEDKDLSYDFTVNGCATGKVAYKDDNDLCEALRDDQRNNYCAGSLRYEQFKKSCPGRNWNTP
jgi:hypothetical protein